MCCSVFNNVATVYYAELVSCKSVLNGCVASLCSVRCCDVLLCVFVCANSLPLCAVPRWTPEVHCIAKTVENN